MSGIRIAGSSVIVVCGPPFSALEGTSGDGDANVYRTCSNDVAGAATKYTNFADGGTTIDGTHNAVLSPLNDKILFEAANASTGFTEIWVVDNFPGSTATALLTDASNYYLHPSWHPDGDQFTCIHGAGGAISGGSVVKSSVSNPASVTSLKSAGGGFSPYRPAFNGPGDKIAYIFDQDVGGTGDLRVMNSDGTGDAAIDNGVKYRFQGGQFAWATGIDQIAYDDGATGVNAAYVIMADGTGKTQINANGDGAGAPARVSSKCWPATEDYVIYSGDLALGVGWNPIRAELDGSTTTDLAATHGAWAQDYFRQVIVYNSRIWFINSQTQLGSVALDGTDYRNDLTIDGAAMGDFSTGDGWYYN